MSLRSADRAGRDVNVGIGSDLQQGPRDRVLGGFASVVNRVLIAGCIQEHFNDGVTARARLDLPNRDVAELDATEAVLGGGVAAYQRSELRRLVRRDDDFCAGFEPHPRTLSGAEAHPSVRKLVNDRRQQFDQAPISGNRDANAILLPPSQRFRQIVEHVVELLLVGHARTLVGVMS